jgi:hypothetical protein
MGLCPFYFFPGNSGIVEAMTLLANLPACAMLFCNKGYIDQERYNSTCPMENY